MAQAYIVEAVRTAGGRRNGRLSGVHPTALAAITLDAVIDRSGLDPSSVEDVIMGCVTQVGDQSTNLGRNAVFASNLPDSVPGVTIDRQCGSSQQALHFAAQAVMSGSMDVVIAAGVESMSRVPLGTNIMPGSDATPWPQPILDRFGIAGFSQFGGAEMIAKKHGFSREMLDAFGLASHQKAKSATESGAFADEIIPVDIVLPDGTADRHVRDEGIRYDASAESMATVRLLSEGGVITAATSSQITDGSSAILVVSEQVLKDHGLTPLARIHNLTLTAGDPVIMLEEPLFATDRALKRAGMSIKDIDLFEVNEAFAPVPMAWLKHTGADPDRLNVNGGGIALGHPLGGTGTKLMATLVHALHKRGGRYGLQTMCEGGGIANVTIVERV